MTKTLAIVVGIVFLLIGVLHFIPNPIVGEEGAVFEVNMIHTLVHLVSGLAFLVAGFKSVEASRTVFKVMGVVYLLVAILGFLQVGTSGSGDVLGLIRMNANDNYLHIVLAAVFLGLGFMGRKEQAGYSMPASGPMV